MSKKTLIVTSVMFFAIALSIFPVYAGKGNNKLAYEARIELAGFGSSVTKDVPPEGDPNVRFLTYTEPNTPTSFVMKIGGIDYFPSVDEVELTIIRQYVANFRLIKSNEIYSFEGVDGTLIVSVIGFTKNLGTPEREESVNVVGYGTGYFEGVKITAKGTEDGAAKVHTGSIMGWPGLP
jgi:hypothetical protein